MRDLALRMASTGAGVSARPEIRVGIAHQRCLVHELRSRIACVQRSLGAAAVHDFQTITTATTPAAAHAALATFRRPWAAKWSAVVASPAQWRCLRTTNVIERISARSGAVPRRRARSPLPRRW